jgi:hypothetical protein
VLAKPKRDESASALANTRRTPLKGLHMSRILTSLVSVALLATLGVAPPPPQGGMPEPGTVPNGPPQPISAPQPTPTTDTAILAEAKVWFAQLQQGKVDRSQLEPDANRYLSDAAIADAQGEIGNLGAPVTFVQERTATQERAGNAEGNVNVFFYMATFQNGKKVEFLFAVDTQGKVAALSLSPLH